MAIKTNYMQRMEVRCMCGSWGRLVGTNEYKNEYKSDSKSSQSRVR